MGLWFGKLRDRHLVQKKFTLYAESSEPASTTGAQRKTRFSVTRLLGESGTDINIRNATRNARFLKYFKLP